MKFETPLLDELERGPWPSFVKCIPPDGIAINIAKEAREQGLIPAWPSPPEDHDQGETGNGDSGE